MTAISAAATPAQQFVVVAFNGVSLGIMSFAFGVFDMALHYGVLPDLDVRVVSGEPAAPLTWLTHQRVLRAQQLLESTRRPVEEVARRCGFSSAAALRQHFRRLAGTSPAAYRTAFGPSS